MGNSVSLAAISRYQCYGELNSKMVLPDFLKGLEHWMRDAEDKLPS